MNGLQKLPLTCPAEELQPGDLILLETPLGPTGKVLNIKEYADKAHSRGAYLLVNSTFAPPGLQDPFKWGADMVMHSGSKFLGGHNDMLCGVLATQNQEWCTQLRQDRQFLGNVMGNFESWLGARSLRTLDLRIQRQNRNAEQLVQWFDEKLKEDTTNDQGRNVVRLVVDKVCHASLQVEDFDWLKKQMPNGFGSVFAIWIKSELLARKLPSHLQLFTHATSLGGVESSIEWRRMSDPNVDARVLRLSIGVEDWEDLRDDFLLAFEKLVK